MNKGTDKVPVHVFRLASYFHVAVCVSKNSQSQHQPTVTEAEDYL